MARLITNPDGSPVKYQEKEVFAFDYSNIVKEVNSERRTLIIVGTDETKDRDKDIIRVSGWDLENYRKNPVFLWAHNYGSVPLARAMKVIKKRDPARLEFHNLFPTKGIYPFADMILELYGEQIINACSVGFIPSKWNIIEEEGEDKDSYYHRGKEFTKQELLELSGCAVPSNPNALQNALKGKSFGFQPDDLVKFITGAQLIPRPDKADDIVEEMEGTKTELVDETSSTMVQVPDNLESNILEDVAKFVDELLQSLESVTFLEEESLEKDEALKPYPHEHACRLVDPGEFDKFARKNCFRQISEKCVDYIFGIKEGKSKVQALRFKKDTWDVGAAKAICTRLGGAFEAASPPKSEEVPEEKETMEGMSARMKECEKSIKKCMEDIKKLMDRMDEMDGKTVSIGDSLKSISEQIKGFQDSLAKALGEIQRNPGNGGNASDLILRDGFRQGREMAEIPPPKYNEQSLKSLKEACLTMMKVVKQINVQ